MCNIEIINAECHCWTNLISSQVLKKKCILVYVMENLLTRESKGVTIFWFKNDLIYLWVPEFKFENGITFFRAYFFNFQA